MAKPRQAYYKRIAAVFASFGLNGPLPGDGPRARGLLFHLAAHDARRRLGNLELRVAHLCALFLA